MPDNAARPLCRKKLHYLDLPNAIWTDAKGVERCRQCKVARSQRSRNRKRGREAAALQRRLKRQEAKTAAEVDVARKAEAQKVTAKFFSVPLGTAEGARYRHAVRVRRQRGLM